jgi:hypothetical protein
MTLPPSIRAKIHAMRNPADYDAPKARIDTIRAWLAARGYHLSWEQIGAIIRGETARQQALSHQRCVNSIPGLPPGLRAKLLVMSPIESFLHTLRLHRAAGRRQEASVAAQLTQARQTIAELSTTLSILAAKL